MEDLGDLPSAILFLISRKEYITRRLISYYFLIQLNVYQYSDRREAVLSSDSNVNEVHHYVLQLVSQQIDCFYYYYFVKDNFHIILINLDFFSKHNL